MYTLQIFKQTLRTKLEKSGKAIPRLNSIMAADKERGMQKVHKLD